MCSNVSSIPHYNAQRLTGSIPRDIRTAILNNCSFKQNTIQQHAATQTEDIFVKHRNWSSYNANLHCVLHCLSSGFYFVVSLVILAGKQIQTTKTLSWRKHWQELHLILPLFSNKICFHVPKSRQKYCWFLWYANSMNSCSLRLHAGEAAVEMITALPDTRTWLYTLTG